MKSRRKAYAAIEQPDDFFQFFDVGLPPDSLVAGPPPPPAPKSDREKAAAESGSTGSAVDSSGAADGTGIRRLLGRLKSNESERNDDVLVPVDEILTDGESGTDQDGAGGAKDADAVSQLADIRRRGRATTADNGPPADTPGDANETESAPLDGASVVHGAPDLPPGSSVAIPSTLLQGFPDGDTGADDGRHDEADVEVQWSTAESVSATAVTSGVVADSRVDPASPLGAGAGSPAEAGPPPHPVVEDQPLSPPRRQDDTAGRDAGDDQPGTWMPPADHTEDPFGNPSNGNGLPAQEERRRTLRPVGDYPNDPDRTGTDGNGSSRPIGPLDQIPDMSPRLRDLVADLSVQPSSGASSENPFLKRSRVVSEPHAVHDFSTDPFSATDRAGSDPTPTDNQSRNRVPAPISRSSPAEPVTARAAVELPLEIPATGEQHPEPTVEAEIPIAAAPEPEAAPPVDPPTSVAAAPDKRGIAATPDPERATPDPEPATGELAPSRSPIVASTPMARHPLAAYADADRHPLAAFARRETPSPAPEPPSIDDVFPDEPAPDVEYSVGRQRDFTDVPSIDDLLPPESTETEPTRAEEHSDAVPEPVDPVVADEPVEPMVAAEAIEPDQPSESWEVWQPTEPSEPAAPSESWEPGEPTAAAAVAEANAPAPERIPDVAAPQSTLLRTVDDELAWTAVDDVPDLDGSTAQERADTDERGSWIPPALRGIAPDAHEAAESLPRRRR